MASSPLDSTFDELVRKTLDEWHIPGAAFSVVHGNDTWSKGYGIAQRQPQKDVQSTTLFYVASTTKAQLCATWTVYIASEENQAKAKHRRISWSTPLVDIIGDDPVLQDPVTARQVTLEDAVSHRTGMPRHELSYGKEGATTMKGVVRNLRNLPLHNTLRTHFEYCNTMYMAATHALETVVGKPWAQIVRQYLWEPLNMRHTYAGYDEALEAVKDKGEVLAKGHTWTKLPGDPAEHEGTLVEEGYMDIPEVSGAGCVISTADDYAKWMRCLLSATSPLSEDMLKELWRPRSLVPPNDQDCVPFDGKLLTYALGWFVGSYQGHKVLWHPGGLHGAGSNIMLVPDLEWGMTCFVNGHDGGPKLHGLGFELLDAALQLPKGNRSAKQKVDKECRKGFREAADNYAGARRCFYPDAPSSPSLPLSLPFEEYAGTYTNLGYGSVALTVEKRNDGANRLFTSWKRAWAVAMRFNHVNAEYWLVERCLPNSPLLTGSKAQSQVGADGRVKGFFIAMESSMPNEMFWFERSS